MRSRARSVLPMCAAAVLFASAALAAEDERRLGFGLTVRAGITERVEIALEGEPFVRLRGAQDDTGNSDVALKGKCRTALAGGGPDYAFRAGLSVGFGR